MFPSVKREANKKYILVGADLPKDWSVQNPGGQLTASVGLKSYADIHGYVLEIIDTTQSSFPVPPFHQRFTKGVKRAALLMQFLNKKIYAGVIIFSSAGFSFYEKIFLSLICRLFRTPDLFFVRSGHFTTQIDKSIVQRLLARLLLKIPFRLGAQGKNWMRFYQLLGVDESKILVIHNWLPASFRVSHLPKAVAQGRLLRFIFVGWIVPEKGIREILSAIDSLLPYYQFEFMFVGGGELEKSLRDAVVMKNWTKRIHVLGWMAARDVEALLEDADVFVLPSYAEGFPNALLEAMAKGLPSICTNVGGIADSVIDGVSGFLIPPREVQPLINAMKLYLDDPTLISRHSASALSLLRENHSADINCRKVFDVFKTTTYEASPSKS